MGMFGSFLNPHIEDNEVQRLTETACFILQGPGTMPSSRKPSLPSQTQLQLDLGSSAQDAKIPGPALSCS